MTQKFYVYIMTNRHHKVLYTGQTNNIRRRVREHKSGKGSGFTGKYNAHKLVYFEMVETRWLAEAREQQIKAGSRKKKVALINGMNPEWDDLYDQP